MILALHPGHVTGPHDLWTAWTFEPLVLVSLAGLAWLYGRGVRELSARSKGRGIHGWRVVAFAGGLAALVLALLSPVDALSAALFSAHMTQHLLLALVAAPLLALADLPLMLFWGIPAPFRARLGRWWVRRRSLRTAWRVATTPMVALLSHVALLWLWHVPGPYEAALLSEPVHALEHASFLVSGYIYWWVLARRDRRRIAFGPDLLYLFAGAMQSALLGAVIALSSRLWYPLQGGAAGAWGLTPLEDQQIAGLIMWVPASLIYLAALAGLVLTRLGDEASGGTAPWRPARWAERGGVMLLMGVVLTGCGKESGMSVEAMMSGGDPERGRQSLDGFGCGSCHSIPGVMGARGRTGPPLDGFAYRSFIAGRLSNQPDNLTRWIMDPQAVDSLTAMPDLGVVEQTARDMAAYLYTLR